MVVTLVCVFAPVKVILPAPVLAIVGAEVWVIAALIKRSFSAAPSLTLKVMAPPVKSERKLMRPAIIAGAVGLVTVTEPTPHSI